MADTVGVFDTTPGSKNPGMPGLSSVTVADAGLDGDEIYAEICWNVLSTTDQTVMAGFGVQTEPGRYSYSNIAVHMQAGTRCTTTNMPTSVSDMGLETGETYPLEVIAIPYDSSSIPTGSDLTDAIANQTDGYFGTTFEIPFSVEIKNADIATDYAAFISRVCKSDLTDREIVPVSFSTNGHTETTTVTLTPADSCGPAVVEIDNFGEIIPYTTHGLSVEAEGAVYESTYEIIPDVSIGDVEFTATGATAEVCTAGVTLNGKTTAVEFKVDGKFTENVGITLPTGTTCETVEAELDLSLLETGDVLEVRSEYPGTESVEINNLGTATY